MNVQIKSVEENETKEPEGEGNTDFEFCITEGLEGKVMATELNEVTEYENVEATMDSGAGNHVGSPDKFKGFDVEPHENQITVVHSPLQMDQQFPTWGKRKLRQ